MKCHVTIKQLKKAGITPTVKMIDDHPDMINLMETSKDLGQALPLVEVIHPDGDVQYWNDLNIDNVKALASLV